MAVTVTREVGGKVAGAVYKPPAVIVPQIEPPHPVPVIVQVTAVFADPVTVAVNCCCPAVCNATLVGEIVIATGVPLPRVTEAEADLVASATNVAVTVTVGGFGAFAGAVYKPCPEMLPHVMPLHPAPERLQSTTELEVPVTVAVNGT